MRNLDIATLRALLAIAQFGAVTRAAEALNLTQSALSMQIRRLEEMLGHPLLKKQGRGVALTAFAEEVLEESRKLVALNDSILMRFTGENPVTRLRVGFSSDWLFVHVPRAVRAFREANPGIDFQVSDKRTRDLLAGFRRDEYDVIVTTEFDCPDEAEHLCKVDLAWFGAIGGSAWQQRPLPLANRPVCAYLPAATEALKRAGIDWVHVGGDGDTDTPRIMTLADLGVDIHPRIIARTGMEVIDHGGVLPPIPPTWLNVYLTDGAAHGAAVEFAGYLRHAVLIACGQKAA